jgi:hypothetical protein
MREEGLGQPDASDAREGSGATQAQRTAQGEVTWNIRLREHAAANAEILAVEFSNVVPDPLYEARVNQLYTNLRREDRTAIEDLKDDLACANRLMEESIDHAAAFLLAGEIADDLDELIRMFHHSRKDVDRGN